MLVICAFRQLLFISTSCMDSGSMLNVSEKCGFVCNGEVKLGCLSTVDANGKLLKSSSEKENTAFLLPVTPDMSGEKKVRGPQFALDSPLTLCNSKLREKSALDYGCGIFHTPNADIINSSATANVLLTPHDKKDPDECRTSAARSLNFCTEEARVQQGNDTVLSDEEVVESVYENLLDVIMSNKTEDAPSDMSSVELDDEGSKTPSPRHTGIAGTCPGAPMKAATKTRKINRDSSLCRKLEF